MLVKPPLCILFAQSEIELHAVCPKTQRWFEPEMVPKLVDLINTSTFHFLTRKYSV